MVETGEVESARTAPRETVEIDLSPPSVAEIRLAYGLPEQSQLVSRRTEQDARVSLWAAVREEGYGQTAAADRANFSTSLAAARMRGLNSRSQLGVAARLKIKLSGIKNLEELMHDFNAHGKHGLEVTTKSATRNIKKVGVESTLVALDRLRQLGYEPDAEMTQADNFEAAVRGICSMGDEQFQAFLSDWKHYYQPFDGTSMTFTQYVDHRLNVDKKITDLARIIQQGGFSPQQKERMQKAKVLRALMGRVPVAIVRMGGVAVDVDSEMFPAMRVLDAGVDDQYISDCADVAIRIAERAMSRGEFDEETGLTGGNVFFSRMACLDDETRRTLVRLARDGRIDPDRFFISGSYGDREFAEFMKTRVEKMAGIIDDEEKLSTLALILDLMGEGDINLSLTDAYEEIIDKNVELRHLASFLSLFKGVTNYQFKDFYEIKNDTLRGCNHSLGSLLYPYAPEIYGTGLSDLVLIARDFCLRKVRTEHVYNPSRLEFDPGMLSVLDWMARNTGKIDTLFVREQFLAGIFPTSSMVEIALRNRGNFDLDLLGEIASHCRELDKVGPELLWSNFDVFVKYPSVMEGVVKVLGEKFISTLSDKDRECLGFLQEHSLSPGVARELFLKRNEDTGWIAGGLPTVKFFEDMMVLSEDRNDAQFAGLLEDRVLATFSQNDRNFWKWWRDLGEDGARGFLREHRSEIDGMFQNSTPTVLLVDLLARNGYDDSASLILRRGVVASKEEMDFWSAWILTGDKTAKRYLLDNKDRYQELVDKSGMPTVAFLDEIGQRSYSTLDEWVNLEMVNNLGATPEGDFWRFWQTFGHAKAPLAQSIRKFLFVNRENFSQMVVDGKFTPRFYEILAGQDPVVFTTIAEKDDWKRLLGDETIDKLLESLPKSTKEKRNAFTHNEYDRTSGFILFLLRSCPGEFALNRQEFEIMAGYISDFGFSRTDGIYRLYRSLCLYESGAVVELSGECQAAGIISLDELKEQVRKIKVSVYSDKPVTSCENLTPFEIQLLSIVSGKSKHRFDSGRPSIQKILDDFGRDMEAGDIAPVPEGYEPVDLPASEVKIQFDKQKVAGQFATIGAEIIEAIDTRGDVQKLKERSDEFIDQRMESIRQAQTKAGPAKVHFFESQLAELREVKRRIGEASTLDRLVEALSGVDWKSEIKRGSKSALLPILRGIFFAKVFERRNSSGAEDVRMAIEGEVTARGMLAVRNIVDNVVKDHVLNLGSKNSEGHWSADAFLRLVELEKKEPIANVFSSVMKDIREAISHFEMIESGEAKTIRAIPDRGLIGEMSAYLADVCYSAEYPLLKIYPNVVPFKFVAGGRGKDREFEGSVLVFELEQDNGDRVMLIRAFNEPHEGEINIGVFIERFLDEMVRVGKLRGIKRIVVPNDVHAISNYAMAQAHILAYSRNEEKKIRLKETFNFNKYDITDRCFVAREIVE